MSDGASHEHDRQGTAVRAAGDRTIRQYESWMQTNASAHLLRTARECGITSALKNGQHTLDQLCGELSLDPDTTVLMLDALVAIGFVEQYEDDYALARAGHLLCQYDEDLADACWNRLGGRLQAGEPSSPPDPGAYREHVAATQWIHTSSAMQASELLGEESDGPLAILDLGCGSAVWSCAIAHGRPGATVVAVDDDAVLKAARSTADSIGLADRFSTISGDPRSVSLDDEAFDLVILAQRLSSYDDDEAESVLAKSVAALRPGGRLIAPDYYRGPGRAGLAETLSRLTLRLSTPSGRVRDLRQCQQQFLGAGLASVQFTYLAASRSGLGMLVAEKP